MIVTKLKIDIIKSSVKQKEIAFELGITENRLSRLLSKEITKDQAYVIYDTLKELEQEKNEANNRQITED